MAIENPSEEYLNRLAVDAFGKRFGIRMLEHEVSLYFLSLRAGEFMQRIFSILPGFTPYRDRVLQAHFGTSTDMLQSRITNLLLGQGFSVPPVTWSWEILSDNDKSTFARWGCSSVVNELFVQGQRKSARIQQEVPLVARRIFLAAAPIGEQFDGKKISPDWIVGMAADILREDEFITDKLADFIINPQTIDPTKLIG